MSQAKIELTKAYLRGLEEIEDFIFKSSEGDIGLLEKFLDAHEQVLEFLSQNPTTPAPHPQTGDQSWPFGDGRYRLFFKVIFREEGSAIYLLDLIDNRMLNSRIYPNNQLPTYLE